MSLWLISFRGPLSDAARSALEGISAEVQGLNIGHGRPELNHVQIMAASDSDALELIMDTVKDHGQFSDWQVTAAD